VGSRSLEELDMVVRYAGGVQLLEHAGKDASGGSCPGRVIDQNENAIGPLHCLAEWARTDGMGETVPEYRRFNDLGEHPRTVHAEEVGIRNVSRRNALVAGIGKVDSHGARQAPLTPGAE
jgi:hypothetical protein